MQGTPRFYTAALPPTCHRPETTMASIFRLSPRLHFHRSATASAALLAISGALAQSPVTELAPVAVTGRAEPPASIGGWGDVPLAKTPLQASVFSAEQLRDSGGQRLADLVGFDPGISDAYNTEGYWDYLTVRGFVLDNRFNFKRDGLPISAETSIPLANKSRIEILKGTSGMQAGTSAPGGLVNYVVKRPADAPVRSAFLEWREAGSVTGSVDISQRFGADQAFGLRVNAAAARLRPLVQSAHGERNLVSLAGDWRVSSSTLIEAEIERSHQSQPSVPGFSMLGNTVPPAGDPRINLNNQPWSLPVVLDGTTASLRWQQRLAADWKFIAHAATQQLRSDDRIAFPYGCFDPNPAPDGTYYADRYCPNGNFDLYDFRSENERRRTDVLDVSLQGQFATGDVMHALTVGVQRNRVRNRFQAQAYNYAGTGNVDGTLVTPPAPDATSPNTNRDEHATELYLRDRITLTERASVWLGLRHVRLSRSSVGTDGSEPIAYGQSFTTPFIAASYTFLPEQLVYASWGQGVESTVVPNQPIYANGGQALPSLKSRQVELGIKGTSDDFEWNVAAFDIVQPQFGSPGTCSIAAPCDEALDGTERHRGAEASGAWRDGPWTLRAGAQWLHARRDGSQLQAELNGRQPTNVPARTLKLQLAYDVRALPGLQLDAKLAYESARQVLPDNSTQIPGYSKVDAAARYDMLWGDQRWIWRAGVDNLFDKRAWRESPHQFEHVYLFPLAPRTFRVSVEVAL